MLAHLFIDPFVTRIILCGQPVELEVARADIHAIGQVVAQFQFSCDLEDLFPADRADLCGYSFCAHLRILLENPN